MFVKITKFGLRRYVKLVESYRDEAGKPRQRVIATLGPRVRHFQPDLGPKWAPVV
ncbi:hypothetical protein IOC61_10765 [Halomonas sp. KAO]|uniref:hypothetical protein n=1 Tax=Halomonas sp. KAO TaxID=2783858 RepID=UPI00189DBE70|nr:hypothetical protein [Halomonas sp. KAO]MBF7053808.1 hypothetical protein [Halomonas sp. KAO]